MTFVIDLAPDAETRLMDEAAKRGMRAPDYARLLLERVLTPTPAEAEEATHLTAIDAAMGAFARVSFSSEDLAREKQEEREREEQQFKERFG
jgi:hypothetical protein